MVNLAVQIMTAEGILEPDVQGHLQRDGGSTRGAAQTDILVPEGETSSFALKAAEEFIVYTILVVLCLSFAPT